MHWDIVIRSRPRTIFGIFLLGLLLFSSPLLTASETFTISASPSALTIPQGNQETFTINTIGGGFSDSISLSASGMPIGTAVSFSPQTGLAPGAGNSNMTITVGSDTPAGTYLITVTGDGDGDQQSTAINLIVPPPGSGWQQGFDFRNTVGYVTDPSNDTYVLSTTAYPTKGSGVTYGWVKTSPVNARDRNAKLDPRLAGINFANNGAPAMFYVDLPSAGTYNLALALGDAGYQACWVQCQVQFLDGSTVLATVTAGSTKLGYFYDTQGNNWSAAAWPASNLSQQVTLAGTRLTVVVGTSKNTGDSTPIAFLGVTQVSGSPNFAISASPSSVTIQQGNQGTSTITTTISGGFNSAIALSASGAPSGTTVSFNPNPIPAPGSGSSTMTITVGSGTPVGTYPITVTGNGGGIQQNTTVTLTVTAQQQPNFTLSASPSSVTIQQGNQGTSTITATISGGFNSAITLSASGAPSGTTVSFNPNPIPAPGSGSSTMTITVGSSTPTGTYPITVTGNGGGIQQNTKVTLTVTGPGASFSISASPSSISIALGNLGTTTITTTISGGFNSAISLSASGLPVGVSVGFNPQAIPAPGAGTSTMTIAVFRLAALGTYPVTVTGKGGGVQQSTTVMLTVVSTEDFELSASPASVSIVQSNQGNTVISSMAVGGFDSAITLSASGTPSGTTVSFNPDPIPAPGSGNSTMTISVSTSTYPGIYTIVVAGSGGGLQRFTNVTLTVVAAPNFAIGASPVALTIGQANQGISTITTFACCGFNNSVSLSVSGAPSGTTLNLNPTTISAPGSGTSTLTVTVGKGTPTGTYPITVTGDGGGIQQNTVVNLTVTGGPQPANANYMEPYSYTLQSSFGQSPYSYQITSGSLPSGLAMNAAGAISGTATTVGKFPFQVLATDSSQPAQKQSSSYTLNAVIGLDEYSGLTAAPVPGCTPNGYFQVVKVKIGNNPARWVYADPLCNAFYQLGIYDASSYFILKGVLQSRYNNDSSKWATHTLQRETTYGFNANDIFYDDYMVPIPKGGNDSGASVKMPFLLFFGTTQDAIYDPIDIGLPEPIKNMCAGQDNNGSNISCNATLDIMDPNWLVANQGELALQLNPGLGGFPDGFNTTPWVVAISLGDADEFVLFKGNGSGKNGVNEYPHPSQTVATSAFNYNLPPLNGTWQRPILYAKAAWTCNVIAGDNQNFPPGQSFLEKKYGSIAALNAAWGSNYTTFCDAGGFGTGTGVLDEDGRHTAWFGNDYYNQAGMNSNLKADLNQYLYIMALQIYTPQISVVQSYDTNHLLMCGFYGGSGDGGVRTQVVQALKDSGCQLLVLNWNSTYTSQALADNQAVYDQIGLPTTVFQGSTSQVDSDMSIYPGNGAGWADYKTQQIRGQHFGTDTQNIFGSQGSSKSNNDYYNLGVDLWGLTDNSNENRNWGFISLSDNSYDGVCATRAVSIDQWGYPCGGEAADYGDFTDGVSQANSALLQQLIQQLQQ